MFLRYKGQQKKFTLKMNYLIGGPYAVDDNMTPFEIDDVDAKELLVQNPRMFEVVEVSGEAPPADTDPEGFACDVCGKVLKSAAGLKSHVKQMHPDDGGSGDANA